MVKVTYHQRSDGDPREVTWNGVTFKAGQPVELGAENTYKVEVPKRVPRDDGTSVTVTVGEQIAMIEAARLNQWFEVQTDDEARSEKERSERQRQESQKRGQQEEIVPKEFYDEDDRKHAKAKEDSLKPKETFHRAEPYKR